MSANNQTLIQEYKGKWYVFANIQAESWCEIDENNKVIEGRDNELRLKTADAVCETKEEAMRVAFKLDEGQGQFGDSTEYGVHINELCKDGSQVKIIEE